MIVSPYLKSDTPYRPGSKKATIFNLLTSIEQGESVIVEKFDLGFNSHWPFDRVQTTISRVCDEQNLLAKTKVVNSKLSIYRIS